MKKYITSILLIITTFCFGQSYTSYFTGDTSDVSPTPFGGTLLMGGATENDSAMVWFLKQANGGDIVVIRASGADGYNDYFYSDLGISVNSVETIVTTSLTAALDPYVEDKIRKAEGLWIAGGDQFMYASFWKNNVIEDALNYLINVKKAVVGGTSAGMAIQGQAYFDAANGSVTSATALANPYDSQVSIGYNDFLSNPTLQNVITDTHYNNPDRKGRQVTFLARMMQDFGINAKGIACNEYVSVCIDTNNIARVFGEYPAYPNEIAYFTQVNCILPNTPEQCSTGVALNWQRNNEAIKVYKVPGTMTGSNTFDLNDWLTGSGGSWENWYVNNGTFNSVVGTAPNCIPASLKTNKELKMRCYPNPTSNQIIIENSNEIFTIELYSINGEMLLNKQYTRGNYTQQLNLDTFSKGVYFLHLTDKTNKSYYAKIIKE
jgi:cyanophycinase-like exopeptidase